MNAPLRTFTVSTAVKPCECGAFAIGGIDGDSWTPVPCLGATTKSTFAPGHDAKLKGFMIRSQVAGLMMRRFNADGTSVDRTPLTWAHAYGFGHLVQAGVEKALAKSAAKAKPAPTPAVRVVEAPLLTGEVAAILARTPNPANLSREDEATVREALGTFIADPAEAEVEAGLEQARRDGKAAGQEIVAQLVADGRIADPSRAERMAHDEAPIREGLAAREVANGRPSLAELVKPTGPAEPEMPTDDREVFTAKVGRHFYKGLLNLDGEFEYEDRKGDTQATAKFTRVTK